MKKLSDFKVLTFGCYGTLIDWEAGILRGLEGLSKRVGWTQIADEMLEAHARYEARQQVQTPGMRYCEVLAVVYRRLAEEWGVAATREECVRYGRSVGRWPAFRDSARALQYLKKHFKLVLLANVDNDSFVDSNDRLLVDFDAVYTAHDAGAYKPALAAFAYMLDMLAAQGVAKEHVLHVAESLFHDHAPANQLGIASCCIRRRHAKIGYGASMRPEGDPTYDFFFVSLDDLVEAHQEEMKEMRRLKKMQG